MCKYFIENLGFWNEEENIFQEIPPILWNSNYSIIFLAYMAPFLKILHTYKLHCTSIISISSKLLSIHLAHTHTLVLKKNPIPLILYTFIQFYMISGFDILFSFSFFFLIYKTYSYNLHYFIILIIKSR